MTGCGTRERRMRGGLHGRREVGVDQRVADAPDKVVPSSKERVECLPSQDHRGGSGTFTYTRPPGAPRQSSSSADCWEQRTTQVAAYLLMCNAVPNACWRQDSAVPVNGGTSSPGNHSIVDGPRGPAGLRDRSALSGGAHHGSFDA